LLSKQRRSSERRSSSQEMLPAIKMAIGDWYIDELGVLTREIACDNGRGFSCRRQRALFRLVVT